MPELPLKLFEKAVFLVPIGLFRLLWPANSVMAEGSRLVSMSELLSVRV